MPLELNIVQLSKDLDNWTFKLETLEREDSGTAPSWAFQPEKEKTSQGYKTVITSQIQCLHAFPPALIPFFSSSYTERNEEVNSETFALLFLPPAFLHEKKVLAGLKGYL